MRKYQPIWEAIKEVRHKQDVVFVPCSPKFHARVVKAVVKEKYMDAGKEDLGQLYIKRRADGVCFKLVPKQLTTEDF